MKRLISDCYGPFVPLLTKPASPTRHVRVTNLTRRTSLGDNVEVASHGKQRRRGLLGRQALASGTGLWIVPCEAVHTFGMQFSIDLLYLDRAQRIIKICRDVGPWGLSICWSAHSVLELAAGTITESRTWVGDQLFLEVLDNPRRTEHMSETMPLHHTPVNAR